MEKSERLFLKIVARTEGEKEEAKEKLKGRYLNFRKEIAPYEIPETEREEALPIIEDMETAAQKKLKKYMYRLPKPFPRERIRLLRQGGVEDYSRGEGKYASFRFLEQYIALDRTNSDTDTALNLVHEEFHANSPTAAKARRGEIIPLWSGITVYDEKRKVVHFGGVEEAIIAELTNQVYQEDIKKNPRYQREVDANERILSWLKKISHWRNWDKEKERIVLSGFYAIPEIVEKVKKAEETYFMHEEEKLARLENVFLMSGRLTIHERLKERIELAKLLDEIFKKSKEPEVRAKLKEFGFEFKNRRQIFDEFARSIFTANPLRMRKIIEGALGEGDFRSFVEKSKNY